MKAVVKTWVEVAILHLFGLLPVWLSRLLARVLVFVALHTNNVVSRVSKANIDLCFPERSAEEKKKLLQQSVLESLRTGLELPKVWTESADKSLMKIHSVQGKELIDQAIADGRGVIVIAPHLGNWEYLGPYLGREYQITNLYKPPKNEAIFKIMEKGRNATGGKLAPTNKKGVMMLLKSLKAGGVVGILPDQVPDADSGCEYVDFFGQKTATMTLISNLIQRTGAMGVGCFAKRLPQGGFEIIFQPADPLLYSEDLITSVTGLNRTVEQLIALAPAQYQWEYKRFKKGTEGKRKVYQ